MKRKRKKEPSKKERVRKRRKFSTSNAKDLLKVLVEVCIDEDSMEMLRPQMSKDPIPKYIKLPAKEEMFDRLIRKAKAAIDDFLTEDDKDCDDCGCCKCHGYNGHLYADDCGCQWSEYDSNGLWDYFTNKLNVGDENTFPKIFSLFCKKFEEMYNLEQESNDNIEQMDIEECLTGILSQFDDKIVDLGGCFEKKRLKKDLARIEDVLGTVLYAKLMENSIRLLGEL